ncbi:WG repeat-containing protein [Magnetococcus sp. PR-3]|uniref:WG repeat-containing protein n=1 Tax=Magnetococcus sp. PR-3 TaxID=3120355 RepID=UPI002FCE48DB
MFMLRNSQILNRLLPTLCCAVSLLVVPTAQAMDRDKPLLAVFMAGKTRSDLAFVDPQGRAFGQGLKVSNAYIKQGYFLAMPKGLTRSGDLVRRWYDRTGREVPMPTFDGKNKVEASVMSAEGLGLVFWKDKGPRKYGFVNLKGQMAFKEVFSGARSFSEGLAEVRQMKTKKWGFINTQGRWVIAPQYKGVMPFRQGITSVQNQAGQWALLDQTGQALTDFSCSRALNIKQGIALCKLANKKGVMLYSKLGKALLSQPAKSISWVGFGWKVKDSDGQVMLRDAQGKLRIKKGLVADISTGLGDGLFRAKATQKGPYGYMNLEGTWVVKPKYVKASIFSEKRAFAQTDRKQPVEMINTKGQVIQTLQDVYNAAQSGPMQQGLAAVVAKKGKEPAKVGYITPDGTWGIAPKFNKTRLKDQAFVNGVAPACLDKYPNVRCGIINPKGGWVIGPKAEWIGIKAGFH